jgi:hypothetical protein
LIRLIIILVLAVSIAALSIYSLKNPPLEEPRLGEWIDKKSATPAVFQHNPLDVLMVTGESVLLADRYGAEATCSLEGGLTAHRAVSKGGGIDAILVWKDDNCYVVTSMVRSGHRKFKLAISALVVLFIFAYLTLTFKIDPDEMALVRRDSA